MDDYTYISGENFDQELSLQVGKSRKTQAGHRENPLALYRLPLHACLPPAALLVRQGHPAQGDCVIGIEFLGTPTCQAFAAPVLGSFGAYGLENKTVSSISQN